MTGDRKRAGESISSSFLFPPHGKVAYARRSARIGHEELAEVHFTGNRRTIEIKARSIRYDIVAKLALEIQFAAAR